LNIEVIQSFADEVNQRNEAGSLHPKAPISAMPRRYFRELEETEIPNRIEEFRKDLSDFIEANQATIHARRILVDFHVSPQAVPTAYVEATEDVFRGTEASNGIDELVIFT
jgi:hypothetical protein